MPLLYDIGISFYHAGVHLAAPFKPKARAWVEGRKGTWARLEEKREVLRGCLWMHCASVGEFEQGRPVLEALKKERPELPVLLTFYSPSGYEACKAYAGATHVEYLPADGPGNARRFIQLVKPRAVIWVKYEFWYHWLRAIKAQAIPAFLVSAIFRDQQAFFKWYGGTHRRVLSCFTQLFVQDGPSRELLASIGVMNVEVSGDTRFDRVAAIAAADERITEAERFCTARPHPILVCGSTWPEDDTLLHRAFMRADTTPRCIVAPHEISAEGLAAVRWKYPGNPQAWDEASNLANSGTLLVDRMGLLARLYKYADVAYVGGGFGDGIHSLLEPAAWDKPVIFGPNHGKFAEAQGLIDAGGGFAVSDAEELRITLDALLGDKAALDRASKAAGDFVRARVGATQRIVRAISASLG